MTKFLLKLIFVSLGFSFYLNTSANSEEPHILFSIAESFEYFEIRENKDEFDKVVDLTYRFGCKYKLKITNNLEEDIYAHSASIEYNGKIAWHFSLQSFRDIISSGKSKTGLCINCEIYETVDTKVELEQTRIDELKEKHNCKKQENKIYVTTPMFQESVFKFQDGSRYNDVNISEIVKFSSPLMDQ